MADYSRVLGQSNPLAATSTSVYTVPGGRNATISSIVVTNRSATPTSFRVAISPLGVAINDKHYVYYDIPIPGNDTFIATVGFTLSETDIIRVYATLATLSFSIFGIESDL